MTPPGQRDLGTVPYTYSIVGVQKAGTTTLSTMISSHPLVARSPSKEVHYFDDESRDWNDPDHGEYVCPRRTRRHRIAGDATPSYLLWPRALERMRDANPEMRLIAVFRDPIERLFSHWAMLRHRHAWRPDWPEYLNAMWPSPLPYELPAGFHVKGIQALSGVSRGLYGLQLARGLDLFAREQWLLLEFGAMLTDHRKTLDQVTDHIGVPRFESHPALARKIESPSSVVGTAPTAADITWLANLYADDLSFFERLSEIDVSDWPTRAVLDGALDPSELAGRLAAKVALAPGTADPDRR